MAYSDEQLGDIIHFCVSFIFERFSHERGLFRATVSQTHVREMQARIASQSLKPREEVDPHILAEVIQTSFRGLRSPLLHEVYHEIVSSELVENDFESNKSIVQKWMKQMPDQKYFLLSELFKLLHQLSQLEDSDSGVVQLAYTVAPTICRPLNQAYMSIRHMEDLKRIRPVVLFLIENFADVFFPYNPTPSKPHPSTASSAASPDSFSSTTDSSHVSHKSAMTLGIVMEDKMDEAKAFEDVPGLPFIKPNLLVVIPSLQTTVDSPSGDIESESEKLQNSQMQTYSDSDWKILHALVNLKVSAFMDLDEGETSEFLVKEASSDTHHVIMQAWTARVTATAITPTPTKADLSGVPVSPAHGSIGSLHKGSMQKSTARRSYRRKMVAECKGLRAQISNFEQEFSKLHDRLPKSQERGNMQVIYVKYRELKREIRDSAATDLQRVVRGYFARKMLGFRIAHKVSAVLNRYSSASSGAMAKVAPQQTQQPVHDQSGDLLTKYRELLENKRELKRRLKKFDEDFMAQYNRAPKKNDKEVIRPMYQNYHEIKNNLDSLRKIILQANTPIPEDLREEFAVSAASSDAKGIDAISTDGDQLKAHLSESESAPAFSSAPSKNGMSLDELQQEKKNLHAYLKVYERDFNRIHGRPVTKSEDILPVANEYQRYKELKNIIKDMKG